MMGHDEKTTIVRKVAELTPGERQTSACLIVVSGTASTGKVFKVDRTEMTIGRSSEADIVLDDEGVSRKHAKIILRADGSVQLVDLNSTNGTFSNGERIHVQALRDGDKIQIGSATILKFSYQDTLDEALQRNLYESATRDGLTRLYNRGYFLETLRRELSYSVRHQMPLSLILLDIDNFKRINDTYGHQAGDYVLARLAAKLLETIRTEDTLARFGGEEFVLLLKDATEDRAFLVAERLRRVVEGTEFVYNGQQIKVTVSGGVATQRDRAFTDSVAFVAAADRLLYRAKQAGRNRIEAPLLG